MRPTKVMLMGLLHHEAPPRAHTIFKNLWTEKTALYFRTINALRNTNLTKEMLTMTLIPQSVKKM